MKIEFMKIPICEQLTGEASQPFDTGRAMRKRLMFTVVIGLSFVLFGFGCSGTQQETTINVSGSWSGHLSVDGQGVVASTSSPYQLYLSQTGQEVSGQLIFPQDHDIKEMVLVSGTTSIEEVNLAGLQPNTSAIFSTGTKPHNYQINAWR